MDATPARLERALELPRSIVWDALVDPVLVEGWLHPTARLVGESHDNPHLLERRDPAAAGSVAVLVVDSPELGAVRVEAHERPGGPRGTITVLAVAVAVPGDPAARVYEIATWQQRLDQLEALLRGHPVDWVNWNTVHRPHFEEHLARETALARLGG